MASICFSPLFIGAPTAAPGSWGESWCHASCVSVPSSSGHQRGRELLPSYHPAGSVSVPSSSGHQLRRWPRSAPRPTATGFQSPLHRGTNCGGDPEFGHHGLHCFSPLFIGAPTAAFTANRRSSRSTVSVPSSSGHQLRRWIEMTTGRITVSVPSSSGHNCGRACTAGPSSFSTGFSPLFIGAPTAAAAEEFLRLSQRWKFQSPLHRGTNCGSWPNAVRNARTCFSPLFIGAPTAAGGSSSHQLDVFLAVSVPSSSGHQLRLRVLWGLPHAGHEFQSPLHRGTNCGRCGARRGLARPLRFSPLFIGAPTAARARSLATRITLRSFSPLFIGAPTAACVGSNATG